jgi:integrase
MASIYQDKNSGVFRISFRFGKPPKQFHKSLDTGDATEAESMKGRIESTLRAIEQGWLVVPEDADFWPFVFSGGKLSNKPSIKEVLTIEKLFARYEEAMPSGAMDDNSLRTYKLHKKHVVRILGEKQVATTLTTAELQSYINKRAKEDYRGKPIMARTIKKEVDSFRAVWNWGLEYGLLTRSSPTRGLKYEKEDPKLPVMTWAEIEGRVARGGLNEEQIYELWDCLFLDPQQVAKLLDHVKQDATAPFVYPMFVFIAHTGARRSEMVRSQIEDIDFRSDQVCLREKKRRRSRKLTFRHLPMSPLLREVMEAWLNNDHPGGPHTFCQAEIVARSRKRSKTTGHKGERTRATTLKGRLSEVRERTERPGQEPLTKYEATDHFKDALAGSKWEVVHGFHVFRHSIASNLAMAGVRQEVIDGWLGHQTQEMRERYRHLFLQEKQDALARVFGPSRGDSQATVEG